MFSSWNPNVQSAETERIPWNCAELCGDAVHTLECRRERRLCKQHTHTREQADLCTVLSRAFPRKSAKFHEIHSIYAVGAFGNCEFWVFKRWPLSWTLHSNINFITWAICQLIKLSVFEFVPINRDFWSSF